MCRVYENSGYSSGQLNTIYCEMERDWSPRLSCLGAGILWLLHRRRQDGGRGVVPIVAAILAIIGVLYIAVRG